MTRTRVVRWVDVLTGILVAMSAAFTVYVLQFAHIDLAAVRTGPLVAIGGLAIIVGSLIVLVELPLVVFVLVLRPGKRVRVLASTAIGVVVFVASIAVTGKYTESKLPPRQATAAVASNSTRPLTPDQE